MHASLSHIALIEALANRMGHFDLGGDVDGGRHRGRQAYRDRRSLIFSGPLHPVRSTAKNPQPRDGTPGAPKTHPSPCPNRHTAASGPRRGSAAKEKTPPPGRWQPEYPAHLTAPGSGFLAALEHQQQVLCSAVGMGWYSGRHETPSSAFLCTERPGSRAAAFERDGSGNNDEIRGTPPKPGRSRGKLCGPA
jgi:hypothetical protein